LNRWRIFEYLEPLAKFHGEDMKRQGTTSVVPLVQQRCWALAPASFCFQLFAFQQRLTPESERAICGTIKVVP
jgi:hypothetical protein